MGRTILCPHCKSTFDESILAKKSDPNMCPVCEKSLLGDSEEGNLGAVEDKEEHSDWITWYYYKDEETNCFTLRDKPIDLDKWTDTKLIKEFKAPPRDASGSSEKAKEILRTYVPGAFEEPKDVPKVRCPYCQSTDVQIVPKKFSILTGYATNSFYRVCVRCKRKF